MAGLGAHDWPGLMALRRRDAIKAAALSALGLGLYAAGPGQAKYRNFRFAGLPDEDGGQ